MLKSPKPYIIKGENFILKFEKFIKDNIDHIQNIIVYAAMICATLYLGLSYKFSNQNTYLIDGFSKIDPNFLVNDWFARSTEHYHGNFSLIIQFIDLLHIPMGVGVVGLDLLMRFMGIFYIYKIIKHVAPNRYFIPFMVVMFLFVLERGTSIGDSYLISSTLQPSSIASAFTLMGLYYFLKANYVNCGLALAAAGFIHTNFLILSFPLIGIAHLFLGFEGLVKRGLQQFIPMSIILAFKMPFLLSMIGAENGEFATHIVQVVRSPHHYYPAHYLKDFVIFIGWSVLGVSGIYTLNYKNSVKKRLMVLQLSMMFLVLLASLLTTATFVPIFSKLFFWRLAPFCNLFSQIIFATVIVIKAFGEHNKKEAKSTIPLFGLLIGFFLIFDWYVYEHHFTHKKMYMMLGFMLFSFLLVLSSKITEKKFVRVINLKSMSVAAFIGLGAIFADEFTHHFVPNSTVLNGHPWKYERELYNWVKTTPNETKFLTPVTLQNFRLHGERAIIVDWKSLPLDPKGIMEWYDRLCDVSGIKEFKSRGQVVRGFRWADGNRLKYLRDKYHIKYAVLWNFKNRATFGLPIVFKNKRFMVLSLESF